MIRAAAACCLFALLATAPAASAPGDWDLRERASYLFGYVQLGPVVEQQRMLPNLVITGIEDAASETAPRTPVAEAATLRRRWRDSLATVTGPGDDVLPTADGTWSDRQKVSYLFGYLPLAQTIAESDLAVEPLVAGLRAGVADEPPAVDAATSGQVFAEYQRQLQEERSRAARDKALAGKRYLAEQAATQGVTATPSGLLYEVLEAGEGPAPGPNDRVRVHYTGRLIDGTVFDSSVERGEPAIFNVGGVIAGWTEALQLMKVGARYRLHIPPDLGYGEQGSGAEIPPGAVLVFDVELLGIE